MCINVACRADVAVPQPLLNLLQAHAIGIEQTGAAMGKNHIKVLTGLVDNSCQTDDLRAGANDDQQFQLTAILKGYITIINHCFSQKFPRCFQA